MPAALPFPTPLVVPADGAAEIALPLPAGADATFDPAAVAEVLHYPCEELGTTAPGPLRPEWRLADGTLHLRSQFPAEQEHALVLRGPKDGKTQDLAEYRVYSLAPDLFARRTWKGDLHLHSDRSDGKEPPAVCAALCRRIGLDFMAVTDHRKYGPSLEAIAAFAGLPVDLAICPGEEVHPPQNPVHIINFGGSASVNARFDDRVAYEAAVDAAQRRLGPLPPAVDARHYASTVWCFEQIRAAGGLAIFCHPYWYTGHRYTPAGALTDAILARRPFDAYEVIGGYFMYQRESNALQVARYHDERARGGELPIVGVSDSHGCLRNELFGWYYTLVFAASPALPDLIAAIKAGYSVAVESLPGDYPRAYGPFRLVKYAHFLLRQFYPAHDALCVPEGEAMLAYATATAPPATAASAPAAAAAREALAPLRGRTAALLARAWGGGVPEA